jgi:dihydrofolate synthase/folylpolyglutamate synthase
MALQPGRATVITVAGTNGKGSSIAMLDAMLRAAGHSTGCYTSPHIHRYNERIRIGGLDVDDAAIMAAFDAVDAARGEVSLSYFEFGTLAALWLFACANLDVWILEVGLGGRLDAVNIIDADVALLTSIGIDHVDWLGDTREAIALEKVAISRPGRPLICGDPDPPASLLDYAEAQGVLLKRLGRDFTLTMHTEGWDWVCGNDVLKNLPNPALAGAHQLQNAAAVLMTLASLPRRLQPSREAIEQGLRSASLPGRFERIDAGFEVVLDVAHNPHGMKRFVASLQKYPVPGRSLILFGVMADKDVAALIRQLAAVSREWIATSPATDRALPVDDLGAMLRGSDAAATVVTASSVAEGVAYARSILSAGDRLIVTGSFHTVAEARGLLI